MYIYPIKTAKGMQPTHPPQPQLTPEETALLQTIAQSQTTSAMSAKVLRYLAYGEDILVQLPPLPDEFSEGMPIQFKTGNGNSDLISMFPNPASGQFQVQYRLPDKSEASLEIYNALDKCLYRQNISETGNLHLNISNWPNGIYFYRLLQNGKAVVSNKLMVVQH